MSLFDEVLARGPVRALLTDAEWLAAMLTVEATLARVQADSGMIPAGAADAIVAACRPDRFDPAALGVAAAEGGNPVIPIDKSRLTGVQWQFTIAEGVEKRCMVDVKLDNVQFF